MRRFIGFALIASLFAIAGCSSDATSPLGDDDDDDDGSSGNSFHFSTDGYVVETGEYYHCFFRDFETGAEAGAKVGVKKFAYTPDQGVLHHIVIFSGSTSEGNTDRNCELLEDNWNPRYAGGTSTDPLEMPEGVAMEVEAVEHIVIQFHYLNTGDPVPDNASVDIDFTKPGDDFTPASVIVSGATGFEIPPSVNDYPIISDCDVPNELPGPINVFALWPHMHQQGSWFNIEATLGGVQQTLWDQAWNFGDQPLMQIKPPLVVSGGDNVHTECIYDNPNAEPITYGESSTQEMCFDFFFYYPALYNGPLPCPFDLDQSP